MLETERFFKTLKLIFFFSFFLFMLSWIVYLQLTNLLFLLGNTFLSSFISLVEIVLTVFIVVIKYTSLFFFIGSIIAIIVIFINDWIIEPIKNNN